MTTPEQDRVTLLVVAERLDDLKNAVASVQTQLAAQSATFVPRGEWVLRNQHVDGMFTGHGREIGDLRAELRARRLPWPTVVGAIVSVVALLVAMGVIGS